MKLVDLSLALFERSTDKSCLTLPSPLNFTQPYAECMLQLVQPSLNDPEMYLMTSPTVGEIFALDPPSISTWKNL